MIAPASTGRDSSRRSAVIATDQTNKGIRSGVIPVVRILIAVVMKFTAPRIDETPARCNLKIARSTDAPAWAIFADNGGYTVHPVPAPFSTILLVNSKDRDGGNNQNLMLFIRGNAMSGAPSINGTNQFPNPPIIIGITIKKIIINAWAVTITLKIWSSPIRDPGFPSSVRINILRDVPVIPAHAPKIKYNVPMSLWLVEKSHLFGKMAEFRR